MMLTSVRGVLCNTGAEDRKGQHQGDQPLSRAEPRAPVRGSSEVVIPLLCCLRHRACSDVPYNTTSLDMQLL